MLIRASIFAMLASLGSAAGAQTTNCHWVGQTWTCDTVPRTTLDPSIILHAGDAQRAMPNYGDVMEQRARIQAQQAQVREQQEAQQRQDEAFRQQQLTEARGLADRQQREAGWQYTTWGMSPRQAAIASRGDVPESPGIAGQRKKGLTVGNVGSYDAGTRHFDVVFYYTSSGLYDVTLNFNNGSGCSDLRANLIGVYGDPIRKLETFVMSSYEWRDEIKNNSVTLTDFGQECTIMYRPLRDFGL